MCLTIACGEETSTPEQAPVEENEQTIELQEKVIYTKASEE